MTNCPCCSHQMLRHIRHNQTYWFCRHCWQEMPSLEPQSLSLVPLSFVRPLDSFRLERSLATV